MVDIEAATEASIVVTNVPDVFIEEVTDREVLPRLRSPCEDHGPNGNRWALVVWTAPT